MKQYYRSTTEWNCEKIGVNLCCFYTNKRNDVVILEYDFKLKGFLLYSDYLITHNFVMNNRNYDRLKPGNINRYYRLCSSLPYKEGCKLFE